MHCKSSVTKSNGNQKKLFSYFAKSSSVSDVEPNLKRQCLTDTGLDSETNSINYQKLNATVTINKSDRNSTCGVIFDNSKRQNDCHVPMPKTIVLQDLKGKNDVSHEETLSEGVLSRGQHEHNFYDFLSSQKRRDCCMRSISHPEFDNKTIQLPNEFIKGLTPAMLQWWMIKSKNMDTVLFFKVGKFYELFHMDADVGFLELDLIYMKGCKAHSGFPEIAYGKFCNILVTKGYRVARIEQTETPEMLKERNDKSSYRDKVVTRELCSMVSMGTRTSSHFEIASIEDDVESLTGRSILLCIKENFYLEGETKPVYIFGICIVDTIIGTVSLSQFRDDSCASCLRTILAFFNPTEVLLEVGSMKTANLVRQSVPTAKLEMIRNNFEMPSGKIAYEQIVERKYFTDNSFPEVLRVAIDGLKNGSSELVMCAFGGAMWQLHRSMIDHEIFSLGKFVSYIPSHNFNRKMQTSSLFVKNEVDFNSSSQNHVADNLRTNTFFDVSEEVMVLDEVTLTNLEILVNSSDHTENGSLWSFVNRCSTLFGQRLLRKWLCHPLLRVQDINKRTSAVKELLSDNFSMEVCSLREILRKIPDLERLLVRIHSNGIQRNSINHPDSRAILYEHFIYNTRKIKDFSKLLTGFEAVLEIGRMLEKKKMSSEILRCVLFQADELEKIIAYYRTVFDESQARKDGTIKPKKGFNKVYDVVNTELSLCKRDIEQYLCDMKRLLGVSDLKYYGVGRDRYQIEVPINSCNKVPSEWNAKSQKKTHRRYWTPFIEKKFGELIVLEEQLKSAQDDTMRHLFRSFDCERPFFESIIRAVAVLDALLSLALVSSASHFVWPNILERNNTPVLTICDGRHPMLENAMSQGGCICNSVTLGKLANDEQQPSVLILSGPNMGGKSTLLRQTCLITILAQLGCKVPAANCSLTVVDRIFTRVGATDKILTAQSTFFVELSETNVILQYATKDSLCILDELGRGTATFDGTAIAHSVLNYISSNIECRALFATHYHTLVDDWCVDPKIIAGHMDCICNNIQSDSVTFLYKLCPGPSSRSYGINVAMLAGLPDVVIEVAKHQSRKFELKMKLSTKDKKSENFHSYTDHCFVMMHDKLTIMSNGTLSALSMFSIVRNLWNSNIIQKLR